MAVTTCYQCGSTYQSNHCKSCHRSFSGQGAFDSHRTGTYEPNTRRCLTDKEMEESGRWRITEKGLTTSAKMSEEAKARLKAVAHDDPFDDPSDGSMGGAVRW